MVRLDSAKAPKTAFWTLFAHVGTLLGGLIHLDEVMALLVHFDQVLKLFIR